VNDDLEFHFMVNHLTRGNQLNRRRQAEGLRKWARDQDAPIVAAGDYNFDYDFRNLTGNQAMSIFMRREANDGGKFVWDWVIPGIEFEIDGDDDTTRRVNLIGQLVDTNWDGNGTSDSYRDSLLDFVFVAQEARDWAAESTVIVRSGDFPDDASSSDHRPVEAVLDPKANSVDVGGPRD
jgi:endonuclease/exonuclease/phosphatase family metal-dependent hydrolase